MKLFWTSTSIWVAVGTYSLNPGVSSIDVAPLLTRHFFEKANNVRIQQTTPFLKI